MELNDERYRRGFEEAMYRYAERLVALHRLNQAMLRAPSSRAIAEAAIVSLEPFVPHACIDVTHVDAATGAVVRLAASGEAACASWPGAPIDALAVPPGALHRHEVYHRRDLAVAPDEAGVRALREAGYRTLLQIPLIVREQVIGALTLAAREVDAFSVEHVDVARETATQLALALHGMLLLEEVREGRERLEQLSRRLVQVQEEERRHLALELHDEVGQMLTALGLALDVEPAGLPEDVDQRLRRARDLVARLTAKVRGLSLDLRPSLLDDLGLLPAFLAYFKRYTEQTGVHVRFRHAGVNGRRFPAEIETAAFRVVQEALTNVARHAGVGEVSVQALGREEGLALVVEDAGRGFMALRGAGYPGSSGISGMRERARLVGGSVDVEPVPGGGVRVRAWLPFEES